MKRLINLNWLLSGLLMTACVFTFTACSSDDDDDDGGQLTTPTYAEDAVKFEIQDANSPYQSIELTPSGDYIVIKNGTNTPAFAKGIKTLAPRYAENGSSSNSNVINGKYTKNTDGSYKLEDFGTITMAENKVTIVAGNGHKSEFTGIYAPKVTGVTSDLFRTWKATKYRIQIKGDGYNEDKTFNNFEEFMRWANSQEDPDENMGEGTWYQPNFAYIIISPYSTLAISATEYFDNKKITTVFLPLLWVKNGNNGGMLNPEYVEDGSKFKFDLQRNHLIFVWDESEDGEIFKMTVTCDPA